MEVVNLIFSAENIRTIVLLLGILYGVLYLDRKFEKKLDEKLDTRFSTFHKQLKENDFAHLEKTIKALTFMLEKNKFLTVEDKNFVDSHLEN